MMADTTPPASRPPGLRRSTITTAQAILALIAVSHVAIPLVMLSRRSMLENEIRERHLEFTTTQVLQSASVAIHAAVGFHAVLAVLCVVLIVVLPRRRKLFLRLTIASQLAAIVFSAVSWSQSSMFHPVIPVLDVLALAVIVCVVIEWRRPGG